MNMKKIKLSPFWLAILVAMGVLVFGLAPYVAAKINSQAKLKIELKRKDGDLKGAALGTPSKADLESWAKYKAELVRSYGDITKFYSDSDKFLERWFPNLLLGADGDPARDTFMARYLDEGRQLGLKLAADPYKVAIGVDDEGKAPKFGFNWEDVKPDMWTAIVAEGPGEEKTVLRELQKRYWARHRLANVVTTSNVKISRVVDFRFFKALHPKLVNAPWAAYPQKPEDIIHWQGVGADPTSGQPRGFVETDLPSDLGKTLTFGFAVELPYSEVPKAIREILNPGNEASTQERMLVNLIGTHITIRDQNEPLVTYTFEKDNKVDEEAKKAAALQRAGGDKARPVLLAVTCQIIDFDPTKVKKFDGKLAQEGK